MPGLLARIRITLKAMSSTYGPNQDEVRAFLTALGTMSTPHWDRVVATIDRLQRTSPQEVDEWQAAFARAEQVADADERGPWCNAAFIRGSELASKEAGLAAFRANQRAIDLSARFGAGFALEAAMGLTRLAGSIAAALVVRDLLDPMDFHRIYSPFANTFTLDNLASWAAQVHERDAAKKT